MKIIEHREGIKRHYKLFSISFEAMAHALRTGGFFEVLEGIPRDGDVKRVEFDGMRGEWVIVVEHMSYPAVLWGSKPPQEEIVVKTYQGPEIAVFKKFASDIMKAQGNV